MDHSQWEKSEYYKGKYHYYNNTRKIQRSLKYNQDPTATVIHHLRDTEEQRQYNDAYYELCCHNLDGTFEYGKYVVFLTRLQHKEIHAKSEETKLKTSTSLKPVFSTTEQYQKRCLQRQSEWNDERRAYYRKMLLVKTTQCLEKRHQKRHDNDYQKHIKV